MKTKVTLSGSLKRLLFVSSTNGLANSLSSIFVNVYLYRLSENFYQVALFNFVAYLVWLPMFVFAGWLSKRVDRKIGLLLGGIFQLLFYLVVLLLGKHAIDSILLIGCIFGVGSGFYWLSINVFSVDLTNPTNRDWYNSVGGIIGSISAIVGPFLGGMIVKYSSGFTGYQAIFFVSFLLFFVSMYGAFRLPASKETSTFSWHLLWNIHRVKEWRRLDTAFIGLAFRDGVLSFVIWLWVYFVTQNETKVGNFAAITTTISILVYYLIGKNKNENLRNTFFIAGSLFLSLSLISLVYSVSWYTLIFYSFAGAICNPFIQVPYNTITYNAISEYGNHGKNQIELVVAREMALSVGRITSVGCLAFLYDHHFTPTLFRWFMILVILFGCLPILFVRNQRKDHAAGSQKVGGGHLRNAEVSNDSL